MLDILGAVAAAVAIEGVVDDVLVPAWRRAVVLATATSHPALATGNAAGAHGDVGSVVVVPAHCIAWEPISMPSSARTTPPSATTIAATTTTSLAETVHWSDLVGVASGMMRRLVATSEDWDPSIEGFIPSVAVEQHTMCRTPATAATGVQAARTSSSSAGSVLLGSNRDGGTAPHGEGCTELSPLLSWSMSRGNSSGGITSSFSPNSDDRPANLATATPRRSSLASPALPLLRTLEQHDTGAPSSSSSMLPPPTTWDPCLIVLDLDNTLLAHMLEDVSVEHLTEAEKRCLFIDAPFLNAFCEVAHARGHLIGVASYANESGCREYSTCTEVLGLLDTVLPLTRPYLNSPLRIVCYPEFRRDHRPRKQPHIDRLIQNFSLIDDLLYSSSSRGSAAATGSSQRSNLDTSFGAVAASVVSPSSQSGAVMGNAITSTAAAAWVVDDAQLSFSSVLQHGTGWAAPQVRAESPFPAAPAATTTTTTTAGTVLAAVPATDTPPSVPPGNVPTAFGGRTSTGSTAGRGIAHLSSTTSSSPGWRSAKPPSLLAVAAAQHEHHQQQMGVSSGPAKDVDASPTTGGRAVVGVQRAPISLSASFPSPIGTTRSTTRCEGMFPTGARIPSTVVLIDDNLGNCTGTAGALGFHCPTGFRREWFRQELSLQATLGISFDDIEATGILNVTSST